MSRFTPRPPLPLDPTDARIEALRRARHAHLSSLVALLEAEVGTRAIHTAVDPESGLWTAWIGRDYAHARHFERATERTEPGAVRRLLNAIRGASPGRSAIVVVWRGA